MPDFSYPARPGATPETLRERGEHCGDLFLVVFRLVQFQQQFHVLKGVIDVGDEPLFHFGQVFVHRVHALVHAVHALTDICIEIADAIFRRHHGIDERRNWEDNRNYDCQDLLIGQSESLLPDRFRLISA
jgi:hypothetical protein